MIGESEAQAIMLSIQGIKPPRPFTHDLMRSIIAETGNGVDRIVIGEMHDEIYFAKIYMDKGRYAIDSRPSDAIALAMGMNAPIYVNSRLLETTLASTTKSGGKIPDTARALGLTVEQLTPDLARYFDEPDGRGVLVSEVLISSAKKRSRARRHSSEGKRPRSRSTRRLQQGNRVAEKRRNSNPDPKPSRLKPDCNAEQSTLNLRPKHPPRDCSPSLKGRG